MKYCLLVLDGSLGSVLEIGEPEIAIGSSEADPDLLSVECAFVNGIRTGDAADSLRRGGAVAARFAARFSLEQNRSARGDRCSSHITHLEVTLAPFAPTNSVQSAYQGNSGDLVFALATFFALIKDLKCVPNIAEVIAATGTLVDEHGKVGSVDGLLAKLDAAVCTLPNNSVVFFPSPDVGEIGNGLYERARGKGIEIVPVNSVADALIALGISIGSMKNSPPYRALEAYRVEDFPFFFGQEEYVDSFLETLRGLIKKPEEQKHTTGSLILANSGAGKSSFVQAGVLSKLRTECRALYAIWQPRKGAGEVGSEVTEYTLVQSVLANWSECDGINSTGLIGPGFSSNIETLNELVRALHAAGPVDRPRVWVVDQFEEIVTQRYGVPLRVEFGNFLRNLQSEGVWIIATLRAEYQGALMDLQDGNENFPYRLVFRNLFYLGVMGKRSLRAVVSKPAAVAGVKFETKDGVRLDDTLLDDASGAEAMPLVGYALHLLWEHALKATSTDGSGSKVVTLTFQAYEEILGKDKGGLKSALGTIATRVFDKLGEDAKAELPRLLDALAVPRDDTRMDVARPTKLSNWPDGCPGRVLIEALRQARLLTIDPETDSCHAQVRVVHEAIFEFWDRAKTVLEKSRERRKEIKFLRYEFAKWTEGGRLSSQLLMSEAELDMARRRKADLASSSDDSEVVNYIDLSLKANRNRERNASLLRGLAMLAISVFLAMGYFALERSKTAKIQFATRLLLEGGQSLAAGDPRGGIRAALDSMNVRDARVASAREEALLLRSLLMLRADRQLQTQPDPAAVGDVSSDGRLLLTASRTGLVSISSIDDSHPSAFIPHEMPIKFSAFFGKENHVVTVTDSNIAVWTQTASKLFEYRSASDETVIAFDPKTGRMLLRSARHPSVRLLVVAEGREESLPTRSTVRHAAFSRGGNKLLVSDDAGRAALWFLDQTPFFSVEIKPSVVDSRSYGEGVAISADGNWTAAAFQDRSIRACHVIEKRLDCHDLKMAIHHFSFDPSSIRVEFSPDSSLLIALASYLHTEDIVKAQSMSAGHESIVAAWAVGNHQAPEQLAMFGVPNKPTQLAFGTSNHRLVLSGRSSMLQILDLTLPIWEVTNLLVSDPNTSLLKVFNGPAEREMTFLSSNGSVSSLDISSRYPRRLLVDPKGAAIHEFRFNSKGNGFSTLVSSSSGHQRVEEWTWAGSPFYRSSPESLSGLSVSKASNISQPIEERTFQRVPSCWGRPEDTPGPINGGPSNDAVVRLPDMTSLSVRSAVDGGRKDLRHPASIRCVAVSSDGKAVAAADIFHIIHLWNIEGSPKLVAKLIGHRGKITDLTFSPDNRRLLSSSEDATARLWILGDEENSFVALEGHNRAVEYSQFDPSGSLVGTLSADRNLRLWEVPSGARLVELAKQATSR